MRNALDRTETNVLGFFSSESDLYNEYMVACEDLRGVYDKNWCKYDDWISQISEKTVHIFLSNHSFFGGSAFIGWNYDNIVCHQYVDWFWMDNIFHIGIFTLLHSFDEEVAAYFNVSSDTIVVIQPEIFHSEYEKSVHEYSQVIF